MGLDQSEVLTVGSLVQKEGSHTLPHNTLPVIPPWCSNVSAATLHPRRSEVNSGQCTPIQSDSAHFRTLTYGKATQIFTRTVPVYYGHARFNSGVRCG